MKVKRKASNAPPTAAPTAAPTTIPTEIFPDFELPDEVEVEGEAVVRFVGDDRVVRFVGDDRVVKFVGDDRVEVVETDEVVGLGVVGFAPLPPPGIVNREIDSLLL